MFDLGSPYYYYAIIGLQVVCIIHLIRKGGSVWWIWLIIFVPVIGSLAYIFTQVFTKKDLKQVQSSVGTIINPGGRIKELEERMRFADTFNNRIALADAYVATGDHDKAIEIYESALTGLYEDNEYAIIQLIAAYYAKERFDDILKVAPRIHKTPDFARSRSRLLYALALDKLGKAGLAEKEFNALNTRFSAYEARYEFGAFLERTGKPAEAKEVFEEMLKEASHLSAREKKDNRVWISYAQEKVGKIEA